MTLTQPIMPFIRYWRLDRKTSTEFRFRFHFNLKTVLFVMILIGLETFSRFIRYLDMEMCLLFLINLASSLFI